MNVADASTPIDESTVREITLGSSCDSIRKTRRLQRIPAPNRGVARHPFEPGQASAVDASLRRAIGSWWDFAHRRLYRALELTAIHPFGDGNGRTARLLLNLMLLRAGYPPIAVRTSDRSAYLDTLQSASPDGDLECFQALMRARLLATLDDHTAALAPAPE